MKCTHRLLCLSTWSGMVAWVLESCGTTKRWSLAGGSGPLPLGEGHEARESSPTSCQLSVSTLCLRPATSGSCVPAFPTVTDCLCLETTYPDQPFLLQVALVGYVITTRRKVTKSLVLVTKLAGPSLCLCGLRSTRARLGPPVGRGVHHGWER